MGGYTVSTRFGSIVVLTKFREIRYCWRVYLKAIPLTFLESHNNIGCILLREEIRSVSLVPEKLVLGVLQRLCPMQYIYVECSFVVVQQALDEERIVIKEPIDLRSATGNL